MSDFYVAAVDLGSYKVVGAVAKKSETGIEIIDIESDLIEDGCFSGGVIKSADAVAMHVNTIVQKLKNASGISNLNHIYLSWHNLNPNDMASKKVVKNLLKQVMVIYPDKKVQELLIESLTTENERKRGVLLIDFGDTHTSYSFIDDSKVKFSSTIPGGSRLITADLQTLFNYDHSLADKLKRTLGKAIHTNEPDKIIRLGNDSDKTVRISELSGYILDRVEDIFKYIIPKVTQSKWNSDPQRSIVLAGGGSLLKHLDTLMQERTGLSVRIVDRPELATLNVLLKYAEKPCDDERPSQRSIKKLIKVLIGKESEDEKKDGPTLFSVSEENEKM